MRANCKSERAAHAKAGKERERANVCEGSCRGRASVMCLRVRCSRVPSARVRRSFHFPAALPSFFELFDAVIFGGFLVIVPGSHG